MLSKLMLWKKPAQSNNAKGGQQGATGEANGTQGDQPPTP